MNHFVACGGTGAHVMLAMVRLHILGRPFGFFCGKKGANFPDLFLVDQDSGLATENGDMTTAWGEVNKLVKEHPGQHQPQKYFGINRKLRLSKLTPLPVDVKGDWYEAPNHKLEKRFVSDEVISLITTDYQRKEIDYSHGMMASPAMGSLLFALKEYDKASPGESNNDSDYDTLLTGVKNNPVVVCGSIVGGTGASVTPTLAHRLKKQGADVMAVLVHRWFELTPNQVGEFAQESKQRNKEMKANAAGGLASSGEELAKNLPTVVVGATNKGMKDRMYGGDNLMPIEDSYVHVVAALAGMKHLLYDIQSPGLYGVSASNAHQLTYDIELENSPTSSLGELLDLSELFSEFLGIFCYILDDFKDPSKIDGFKKIANYVNYGSKDTPKLEVCKWVYNAAGKSYVKATAVSSELRRLQKTYDGIRIWLKRLTPNTNSNRVSDGEKLKLSVFNKRIKEKPLPSTRNANATEQYIAASLYHWIAEWVQDHYNGKGAAIPDESTNTVGKGYVPSTVVASLVLPFGSAGTLVADKTPANFKKILASYFDQTEISHNGWPHAFAASKQFKYLIENYNKVAIRKLEMLLVGHALGHLHLEEVKFTPAPKRKPVSAFIETLIEQEGNDLAAYRLRSKKRGIIFGFSSPDTLLCPTPNTDDTQWEWLWQEIVEHTDPGADWETSDKWGYRGDNARRSVATWIKRLILLKPGNSTLHWANVISDGGSDRSFGIAEWLLLKDDTNENRIPLPIDKDQPPISLPSDILKEATPYDVSNNVDEEAILKEIKGFNRWNIFTRIPNIFLPGQNHEISLIWKEHLDSLQEDGQIFSWGTWKDEDQIWIMMDLEPTVIQIKNIRVIDLEKIQISSCIPLSQNPVPGSSTQKGAEIFPDLPLRPEYISLARVPPNKNSAGEILIDQNWDGLSQYNWDAKNRKVTWEVDLIGRDGLTKIEFESDKIADTTSAHWMIWPNFKSPKDDPTPWRAYYLYEDSSTESLEAHVLTQENSGRISEPKKRPFGVDGPCRSVEYKNGQHAGDAPVALCAYDGSKNEYVGIYKIKLDEFAVHDNPNPWKFAVDFGTSHTVAARQSDDTGGNKNIPLHAELTSQKEGMSLHISENWPQDTGNNPKDRKEFLQHLWRPTYNEKQDKKLLRSDLWSLQKSNFGKISNVRETWEPMTHYALPSWDLDSENDKHVISGFKWEMQSSVFLGYELWLQERYLQMVIEIFVAEIIREKQQFPNEIQFTFTYPLRGVSDGSTDNYQKMIQEELFPNCAESLGCILDINKDLSLYSESHAAARGAGFGNPYEVILVADLGGGTLDTFISTIDRYPDEKKSRFKKNFADSAKIGVNHLLRIFAGQRGQYLPKSTGWGQSDETAYINLCAWMRSEGSPKLFGSANTNTKMGNLQSFSDPKGGSAARMLIDRYFQLLVDFLARSIVAYVADDICKHLTSEEIYDIGLFVKLQGNGWRVWYQSEDCNEIHQHILALVISRANQLWEKTPIENPDVFKRQGLWCEDSSYDDVKTGPILAAVGKNHNPRQAYAGCKKYPLSKIKIFQDSENVEKNWFDPLPFEGIGDGAKPQIIKEFDPPLCVDPNSDQSITMIEIERIRAINEAIQNPAAAVAGPNTIDVPVGSFIWEQVIKSDKFLKND